MATHDPISPSATGASDWLNRTRTTSTTAASDLEEEVRQSRLDRQNRRRRLSGQGVRGFPSSTDSHKPGESESMSPQHTGGSTTSPGEKEATLRRLMSANSQDGRGGSDAAASSTRASGLLSRYGGQAGPTGTADAGSGASPVSLASFMGGRAAGPRLGKLAGDGRSAPPEASLIDETRMRRGVALPGLATAESPSSPGKGRGLASFLEARAGGLQQRSDAFGSSPGGQPSSAARSPSPVRRAASPTKQTPLADAFKTPTSPVKRSASPSKPAHDVTSLPAAAKPRDISPSKANINTLSVSPMKNAATSPIQKEEITSSSFKQITPSSATATPSWRAPTSAPAATTSTNLPSPSRSLAFASPAFASKLASDKGPTPSLTRLQGKGMVGQRLKEAKEREAAAATTSSPSTSPALTSPSKFPLGRTNSSGSSANASQTSAAPPRWAAVDTTLSQQESEEGALRANRWTPHRSGTALPGLSRADSASSPRPRALSPTRASTAPSSSGPTDDRYDVAPVRLPGMGSARSPFGVSGGRASPDKEKSTYFDSATKEDVPLEHLTKGRARGPARRSARGPTSEAAPKVEAPESEPAAPVAESSPSSAAAAPLRNTSGKRIAVLISGSGSNLQALIDATHKGGPLSHAQITYVLSNRKAAFGLQRAATSNPPIATKVLALKTWQNRNEGGTREQYDEVLAKAVLDAEGAQLPDYDESKPSALPPPDLIVLAGFMHIVSPQFLRALGHRTELSEAAAPSWRPTAPVPIINLHPALPGAFDGANAIPRAFEAFKEGKIKNTGIMVHEVIAEVDRGAPIVTKEVPIYDDDILDALETRMHAAEHKLIVEGTRIMLSRAASGRTQTQQVDQPASPTKIDVKESIKTWGSTTSRSTAEMDTKPVSARWGQSSSARPASPTKTVKQTEQRPQPSRHVNLKLSEPVSSLAALTAQHKSVLDGEASSSERATAEQTVSVETLSVQSDDSASTIASHEAHILYETETLAVVHRYRSSSSGQTIATKLYARAGHQASSSSQVAQKLSDLAKRYSASVVDARQGREDAGLVRALGGKVETRQGSRRGWDKSNSLMWRVQEQEGVIFIDQVDLSTGNLCSAYSYLLSIVGNVFVWKGKGSTTLERETVSAHARKVFGSSIRISEQDEGIEDKSFWTFLDKSGGYASAWHLRHRSVLPDLSAAPRLFHISGSDVRVHEGGFTATDVSQEGIAVLLLPAEVYLLVGKDARSRRGEIALGLSCAEHLGKAVAARRLSTLPSLPVHALIYPTLEPRDLVASLRYWQENSSGPTARKVNVVSLGTAKKELLNNSGKWRREVVQDRDYLPLGVGPGDL